MQTCNTKECVEYIGHVTWSIGDTAALWILCRQDERYQFSGVNVAQFLENGQSRKHPEAITHLVHENRFSDVGVKIDWIRLTSSSFWGRPFRPPLGSWRSESHHESASVSTMSSLSRIASAATHTNTVHSCQYQCHFSRNETPQQYIPRAA